MWLAGAVLTALAGTSAVSASLSPPFSVTVETSWAAPPLLLEILEVAHDEDPSAYFPLLKLLTKHSLTLGPSPTPQKVLETALDVVHSHDILPKPGSRSTFELALALHTAAPRIAAAYADYTVDEAKLDVAGCASWVEWRGKGFCDAEQLQRDVERSIDERGRAPDPRTPSRPFDRVSHSPLGDGPQAVLYYSPSPEALPLLEYLDTHARAYPAFQYVVRYRPFPADESSDAPRAPRTPLAGYSVEMALKNTDYLVVDDRITAGGDGAQTAFKDSKDASRSNPFSEILGEDPWSESAIPLAKEEILDLGLKAVALIKAADKPLDAFIELSQDLPKYSAALARHVEVPEDIRKTSQRLAVRHPLGPAAFLNGRVLKDTEMNAFGLLKAVRRERDIMTSLLAIGYTPKQAFQLVSDELIGHAETEHDPLEGLVDVSDRIEGGGVITYVNDIEKDRQYARWSPYMQEYLRQIYPGQLHLVRKNTWNTVLVVDLATARGIEAIASTAGSMLQRNVPIRFGVVPLFGHVNEDSGQIARLVLYISGKWGAMKTREFLNIIHASVPKGSSPMIRVHPQVMQGAYERVARGEGLTFEEVMESPELATQLEVTLKYLNRIGASRDDSPLGSVYVNGKYAAFSGTWTQHLTGTLSQHLNHIQEMVASGVDFEEGDGEVATYFYDLPTTAKHRNRHIVPTEESTLRIFNLMDIFPDNTEYIDTEFMYPDAEDAGTPLTTWIVGDLDSDDGRSLVLDAVKHIQGPEASSRLGFIHVPSPESSNVQGYRLSTLLFQFYESGAFSLVKPDQFQSILEEIETKGNVIDGGDISAQSNTDPLNVLTADGWNVADAARAAEFWKLGTAVADSLGLQSTKPHILMNGRLVGPLTADEFSEVDFDTLEVYELRKRVHPVINLVQTFWEDPKELSRDTVAGIVSLTSSVIAWAYQATGAEGIFIQAPGPRSRGYEQIDDGEVSFTIGDSSTALFHVAAIIDPLSELAQRWTPLLKLLANIDHVAVTVYLDPNTKATDFNVKRFYRSAVPSTLHFDVDGYEVAPAVTFSDLPSTPIFTLALDTPGSWVVRPKDSPLDLDNLLLGRLYEPIHVQFDLYQLVLDGHGREGGNVPPRGLQLQLKDGDDVVSDTQVMANLGYFQFKATPGVYNLAIRPGRGEEVYDVESVGGDGWDSPTVNITGPSVTVDALDGTTIYPRFARQPGMENADVLAESVVPESFSSSVLSRMKSMVGLNEVKPKSRHADINIFTVASGLLYERFASIMILSVMKHTDSTVKFWFIENFLSPTFIKFIPHLAEEYGFEYELVTYKWPSWLRAQTEKQRIIWAYKILFLDVLFPMDLDKVIFVDADQIVRVDMKELVDVDLHGHVYGYPPMGNDRVEMEGFRFWKTGYWKEELRGLPYHISALYVVDLKRFRQLATGDRLRGQYQALSADPNSLANLDQDLPNSMQRQIPIFTLDQDWLWCQTWCSDESLATAKTIDLCQNPLTKEPKLVRARQIPEWDVYDREIAAFAATLGSGESGALAANVDDLAAGPGSAAAKHQEKEAALEPEPHADADIEGAPHDEL